MVVLVLQTLSLLTISLVTSTSASTKLLCFRVMSSSRSVLMVERFLAIILALMAAIFSTDMASDNDLKKKKSFDQLIQSLRYTEKNCNYSQWWNNLHCRGYCFTQKAHSIYKTSPLYLIWSVCTMPSLWPSKRAARRSLSRRTRSSSLIWKQCTHY